MKTRRLLGCCLAFSFAACARPHKGGGDDDAAPVLGDTASLSLLFAPQGELEGQPNVWALDVQSSKPGTLPAHRAGDLPKQGNVLKVDALPADDAATVTGGLYKTRFTPEDQTHTCKADAPVTLVAGETASVALSCMPIDNPAGTPPVKVFLKVAQLSATFTQADKAAMLAARDLTAPLLMAFQDDAKRRISLKQDTVGLLFDVGGEVVYRTRARQTIADLLNGASAELEAVAGRQLEALRDDATLSLDGAPLLFEASPGTFGLVLPLKLANAAGTVSVQGRLFEEIGGKELTIVSYNVENLFDQVDDARNAHYGDYRLTPNTKGQVSNYGEPVEFEGRTVSYTDVKVAGIRKALTGIDPAGPEVVGLVEVESKAALDKVLDAMKDLGYTAAVFSEWADGTPQSAIGLGLLTKFPVKATALLPVPPPPAPPGSDPDIPRPVLKVTLDVWGHDLTVYVDHWKSKGGPESQRIVTAEIVEKDVEALLATNAKADFVIMGDLNSDYNEAAIILPEHNDAGGRTGLNSVLKAQGDELTVAKGTKDPLLKYDLFYELPRGARRSAWHEGFGWSTLDHLVIGAGLYDQQGLTYVDNSFQAVNALMPRLGFLFKEDGTTHRWHELREGNLTRHEVGGYSDHAPIYARLRVAPTPSAQTIFLVGPSRPDATDPK